MPYTISSADMDTLARITDAIIGTTTHPQLAHALQALTALTTGEHKPINAAALSGYIHKHIRKPLLDIYTFYLGLKNPQIYSNSPIYQEKFFGTLLALAVYWPAGNDGINRDDFLLDEIGIFFSGHIIKKQTLMTFWEKDRLALQNLRHPFTYQLCTTRDISFNLPTAVYIKHYGMPEAADQRDLYKAKYLNIYYLFANPMTAVFTLAATIVACVASPPIALVPLLYVLATTIAFALFSSLIAYGLGQILAREDANAYQQEDENDRLAANNMLNENLEALNTKARDFLNGLQISRLHAVDSLENLMDPARVPTPTHLEEEKDVVLGEAKTPEQPQETQPDNDKLRKENFLAFFDKRTARLTQTPVPATPDSINEAATRKRA